MIYLPYTFVHPPTWEALAATGRTVLPVRVDADRGYLNYLAWRWKTGEEFVNVEHDVIVTGVQLDQFDACPEPWCAFHPDNFIRPVSFCCTRWRAEFIAEHPTLWSDLVDLYDGYIQVPEGGRRWDQRRPVIDAEWVLQGPAWQRLDLWAEHRLGVAPHRHWPAVVNDRPSVGC